MKITAAILLILITIAPAMMAQESFSESFTVPCTLNYQAALDAYEIGDFNKVIALLSSCSSETLSEEEQIAVFNLLCKTYYYERDMSSAEKYAREVYRLDPEYSPDQGEKVGIRNIFQAVTPGVRYSVSFLLGANFAAANTFTTNNYEGDPRFKATTSSESKSGIDASLQFRYFTKPGIDPMLGISYSQARFIRTSETQSSVFNTLKAESNETDQFLKVDLGAVYTLDKKMLGFKPVFSLGGTYNYVLSSKVLINSAYIQRDVVYLDTPDLDFSGNRNNSFGIFLSAGGQKKIRRGNLRFNIRYEKGISSMVNRSQLLRYQDLIFSSNYFDNDFTLNAITLSIGYERYYYKYR